MVLRRGGNQFTIVMPFAVRMQHLMRYQGSWCLITKRLDSDVHRYQPLSHFHNETLTLSLF